MSSDINIIKRPLRVFPTTKGEEDVEDNPFRITSHIPVGVTSYVPSPMPSHVGDPIPDYVSEDNSEVIKPQEVEVTIIPKLIVSREEAIEEMIREADGKDARNVTFVVRQDGSTSQFVLNRFLVCLTCPEFSIVLNDKIDVTKFEVTDVRCSSFKKIIQYIYQHSQWTSDGNLLEAYYLIKAAREFQLEELGDQILRQVPELISCKDTLIPVVCKILNERRSKNAVKLREDALDYINSHAAELLQSDSFLSLSSEALTEILSKQKLPVSSSLELFKSLLRWGVESCKRELKLCSGDNLREKLNGLMKFVNFFKMSHFEFESYVQFCGILSPQEEQFFTWGHDDKDEPRMSKHNHIAAELFQTQFKTEMDLWELKLKMRKMQENQKLLLEKSKIQSKELAKASGMIREILCFIKSSGPTISEMMMNLTGKFACVVELTNATMKSLQYGKYHCFGLGLLLHPMPAVIDPLTRVAFSFECTGQKKNHQRDRISGGFVYSLDLDTSERIYFVIRFCIRADYGEVALAFVDHYPDPGDTSYFEKSKHTFGLTNMYKKAFSHGGILDLVVEKDSIRVTLSMTVDEKAVMKIQVAYVET